MLAMLVLFSSSAAMRLPAQGTIVSEATWWAHCSARLAVEAEGATPLGSDAELKALSERALARGKSVQRPFETDAQLEGYANAMKAFVQEKMLTGKPTIVAALGVETARCKARLAERQQ